MCMFLIGFHIRGLFLLVLCKCELCEETCYSGLRTHAILNGTAFWTSLGRGVGYQTKKDETPLIWQSYARNSISGRCTCCCLSVLSPHLYLSFCFGLPGSTVPSAGLKLQVMEPSGSNSSASPRAAAWTTTCPRITFVVRNVPQKSWLIRPGNVFPILYCPVLVSLCEL